MTLNDQARTAIIALMEKRELNRVQLAEKMSVTKGYITNLLRPGRKLTLDAVDKAAGSMGGVATLTIEAPEGE